MKMRRDKYRRMGRVFAVLLAFCMLFTSVPMNVYAEEGGKGIFGFSAIEEDGKSGAEERAAGNNDEAEESIADKRDEAEEPVDADPAAEQDEDTQIDADTSVELAERSIQAAIKTASNGPRKAPGRRNATSSANIILTGLLPVDGTVEATPVSVEIEGQQVLLAYDIKILAGDEVWQPEEKIEVAVESSQLEEGAKVNIYHLKDADAEAEKVTEAEVSDGGIAFEVESFSIYAFTVEFHYGDYEYVMDGGTSMLLSDLLKALNIPVKLDEIQSVEFSDYNLVQPDPMDNGDWQLFSIEPFDTEETLTLVLKNGEKIEIRVTDAFIGGTGGSGHTGFASNMDISTITIQDLKNWSNKTVTSDNDSIKVVSEGGAYNSYWYGTPNKGGTVSVPGTITYTYSKAAETSDGQLCDVTIVISDIVIYGDTRGTEESRYYLAGEATGLPSISTNMSKTTDYRYGLEEKVTVNIFKTGTKEKVDGKFLLTVYDLNLYRVTSTLANVYGASTHHGFSEQVKIDNLANRDVFYIGDGDAANRLQIDGDIIWPYNKSGTAKDFTTGFAMYAESGDSITAISGGGNKMTQDFYLMPRAGISHAIESYSGNGGSIETTTTGKIGSGEVLPGGTVNNPRTYDIPNGKKVTYKMTPLHGYAMDKVYVDNTEVTPTFEGDYYTYTFNSVGTTHKINVTWTRLTDPEVPVGHIGMEANGSGGVTLANLGEAKTTSIPADGKAMQVGDGSRITPPSFTGYTHFTYALGNALTVGEGETIPSDMQFFAASDDLQLRYSANGVYWYSVNGGGWEVWGNTVPTIYAVYTKDDIDTTHHVYVTITAIAKNEQDVNFVDPDTTMKFDVTKVKSSWSANVTNPGSDSYTSTVTKTGSDETTFSETIALKPGQSRAIALEYTEATRTVHASENDPLNGTISTETMTVIEHSTDSGIAPDNYDLTNIALKHGAAGAATVDEGKYVVYASGNTVAKDPEVTRVGDSTLGYTYTFTAADAPTATEAEFINTRKTVDITLKKLLEDSRVTEHDFTFTFRAKEVWADGKEHEAMLGNHVISAKSGQTVTCADTIHVPLGSDILMIERFGVEDETTHVKSTDYTTTVTSKTESGATDTVSVYRPLDKEFLIRAVRENTEVTFKNELKPVIVTVKKVVVNGDIANTFDFTGTIKDSSGKAVADYLVFTDEDNVEHKTNASGVFTFKLPGSGSQELSVPYNASLTVAETAVTGYDTYIDDGTTKATSVTKNGIKEAVTITFKNVDKNPIVCQLIDSKGTTSTSDDVFIGKYTSLNAAFSAIRASTGPNFRIEMLVENYNFETQIQTETGFHSKHITLTTAPESQPVTGADSYHGAGGTYCTILKSQRPAGHYYEMFYWRQDNASLTLKNITFDGNKAKVTGNKAGLIYLDNHAATSKIVFESGTTIKNFKVSDHGAVCDSESASGTFEVHDGVLITGNVAAQEGGVFALHNGARIILKGGTITGNIGQNGVFETVTGTAVLRVEVSGDPYVMGNYNSSGRPANIYVRLDRNDEFRVVDDLTDGASVGVKSVYRYEAGDTFGIAKDSTGANNTTASGYSGYEKIHNDLNDCVAVAGSGSNVDWYPVAKIVYNGTTYQYSSLKQAIEGRARTTGAGAHAALSGANAMSGNITIQMLIDNHKMQEQATVNKAGLNLTITTAGKTDTSYPYIGENTPATVLRQFADTNSDKNSMIRITNGNLTLDQITFDGNKNGTKIDSEGIEVAANFAGSKGGIIYVNNASSTLTLNQNATLKNSVSTAEGGAIFLVKNSGLTMNGTIENCSATKGGAVNAETGTSAITVGGSIFGCTASGDGGAISTSGSTTITVNEGTVFRNNTAQNGGAITTGGTMIVNGATFTGNRAKDKGGTIYAGNGSSITMTGGAIVNGHAGTGGGIWTGGTAIVTKDAVIQNCTTTGNGGGIYVNAGSLELSKSEEGDGGFGGSILNCTSAAKGGGIYVNNANLTVRQKAVISNNTAKNGGGIYFTAGSFKMENGRVAENSASQDGGGIYLEGGTITLANGALQHNKATGNGGGIYTNVSTTIGHGVYGGNSASNGGAVYANAGTLTVSNGKFGEKNDTPAEDADYANTATNGGAFYIKNGATLVLTGGEIHSNRATTAGGGIYTEANATANVSGAPVVKDNSVGGKQNNVYIQSKEIIHVTGDLGEDSHIGVYGEDANPTLHNATDQFAVYTTGKNANLSAFYNDRSDFTMQGRDGGDLKVVWPDYIARVSNDGGETWTYHEYLVHDGTGSAQGAFNKASGLTGDVIIETLYETHDRYTLTSGTTFNKNVNITLRTTQDETFNPAGEGHFVSTIKRGFDGSRLITSSTTNLVVKDLIFDGNRDADFTGGIFQISSGSLTIQGGTEMKNSLSNTDGGAVNASGAVLIENNIDTPIRFENCESLGAGGAISSSGTLTINNQGAGITFTQCKSGSNTSTSASKFGGAISSFGGLTIRGTKEHPVCFTDCHSTNNGGAIYIGDKGGSFTYVDFGKVDDNGEVIAASACISDTFGGAIAVNGGKSITITDCNFYGCSSIGNSLNGGGAIANSSGNITLISTTEGGMSFIDCRSANGGGIRTSSITIQGNGEILFKNCSATTRGGGVYTGTLTINEGPRVTFDSCRATYGAGAYTTATVNLNGAQDSPVAFTNCEASADGGGLFVGTSSLSATLTNCSFQTCKAKRGAAVWVNNNAKLYMNGGEIKNNTANSTNGGAIQVGGTGARLYFAGDAKVTDNTMRGNASNVYLDKDSNEIINAGYTKDGTDYTLAEGAYIGVYVTGTVGTTSPGDQFYKHGKRGSLFGTYADENDAKYFHNDRIGVEASNTTDHKMIWGKPIKIEVRYKASLDFDKSHQPEYKIMYTDDNFWPTDPSMTLDEIITEVEKKQSDWTDTTTTMMFWRGYASSESDANKLNYVTGIGTGENGAWVFERNNVGDYKMPVGEDTLVLYYTEPVYLEIKNETLYDANSWNNSKVGGESWLNIAKVVGVDGTLSDLTSDQRTAAGASIRLMILGGAGQSWALGGGFTNPNDGTVLKNIGVTQDGTRIGQLKWSGDAPNAYNFQGLSGTLTAEAGGTTILVFGAAGHTLSISKEVKGEMGDVTKAFTIYVASDALTDASYKDSDDTSYTVETVNGSRRIAVPLKHGETVSLADMPEGSYTISEADTGESYEVTYQYKIGTSDPATGVTFELTDDTLVTVTNELGRIAPTGVNLRFLPYLAILLGGGALVLLLRRRKREEE